VPLTVERNRGSTRQREAQRSRTGMRIPFGCELASILATHRAWFVERFSEYSHDKSVSVGNHGVAADRPRPPSDKRRSFHGGFRFPVGSAAVTIRDSRGLKLAVSFLYSRHCSQGRKISFRPVNVLDAGLGEDRGPSGRAATPRPEAHVREPTGSKRGFGWDR
jgi:hypothetical protein